MSKHLLIPAVLAFAVGSAIPMIGQAAPAAPAPAAAPAGLVTAVTPFGELPGLKEYDLKKVEPKVTDAEIQKYESDLVGRTGNFVTDLKLTDKAKEERMKKSVIAYYRFLRGWHAVHDPVLKPLKRDAKGNAAAIAKEKESLMVFHKAFEADLGSFLTPEQVWLVKDRLVYKRPTIIYEGYTKDNPWLNDAQKAEMLATVKAGCEEAMDEGSSTDKHLVMDQYKGKITNLVAKFKKERDAATAPATRPN